MNPVFVFDLPSHFGLKAVAFTLHGLANDYYSAELKQHIQQLCQHYDPEQSQMQHQGFLSLRQRINRSAKRFPPSPVALHEQYQRTGKLRPISPLVDLYNHWSLVTGLSIGAHDLLHLHLPVRLGLTRGDESFTGIGSHGVTTLPAGEYAYLDAHQQVLCRMDYRQAAFSAVNVNTSAALFIVQGHQHTATPHLQEVAEQLKQDIMRLCPAHSLVVGK
ncbi:hypothetical protein C4K68_13970 [Pokkaliibacter plantistimulans]|uniref:B3/B4 tRNA-binding domain-containing protein n=1 Tax=Proteobacteria bacterium 228 TaxID=2083153 RepID=A0A2S5KQ85_9PROT|nr:phenylalanine--tRNA ligase beta subunit-related protein [Pokkaliibacter plantistimulans]PPC76709.1 hypothetical protein C4K68_13970 [Pokkaliibacter plantistimulans]